MPAPPKSNSSSFPTVPVHCALIALVFGLAIFRFFISDASDRHHCGALLNEGRWLDSKHQSWQPDGCMLHPYKPKELTSCLEGRHIIFVGDSTVRQVFYAAVKHVDNSIDTIAEKHSDRTLTVSGIQFSFFWDPFLNSTKMDSFLSASLPGGPPTLAVIGSGIWYLRHEEKSGGIAEWKSRMDKLFRSVSGLGEVIADEVILLPVEEAVQSRLSPERSATIRPGDIAAMNLFLDEKVAQGGSVGSRLAVPKVFNKLIDGLEEETEDGLHFSEAVSKVQANILLNLRCNDAGLKKAPFDRTCCYQYPTPNWVQGVLLVILLLWGPLGLYLTSQSGTSPSALRFFPPQKFLLPLSIFGCCISFLFIADRTSLFLKENKQYSALNFTILSLASLAAGLFTMKPAEKDLGFLNRDQTDEWKGWMQIAILIYHYLGASKISGIYNPIRVCVAAYLFQTGYGHLTFFLKKGDYGFARVASTLVRLNLLTVVLAYLMETTYLSYYFSPLVTMWFFIIWVTMWAGNKYNERTGFLVFKIVFAAGLMGFYFQYPGPLEWTFSVLNATFNTAWNAKEWRFRVALDMWVVWSGSLTALAFIKIKDLRITDRPEWPQWQRYTIIGSGVTFVGYMAFELTRANKFVYNVYHPYISIPAVLAFCVLRNATPYLRSTSSKFFIFFGQCSLETFILQFHLFIAGDTQGIIMMIPGGPLLRPINFLITSLVFVFCSNQVASATGSLTAWICTQASAKLPTSVPPSQSTAQYVPLSTVDTADAEKGTTSSSTVPHASQEPLVTDPLPTISAPSSVSFAGKISDFVKKDLRVKFLAIFVGLWLLNEIYPS